MSAWSTTIAPAKAGGGLARAPLTDRKRRWSNVSLQRSDELKQGRNRVHLDLYTDDRDGEVTRLEGLDAKRILWEYAPVHDHVVMSDHDGNEFCVIQNPYTQDSTQFSCVRSLPTAGLVSSQRRRTPCCAADDKPRATG